MKLEFVQTNYDKVSELMADLSPLNNKLWGDNPSHWAFRGQRDSTWQLMPSAFRPGTLSKFAEKAANNTNREQIRLEYEVIKLAYYRADRSGLALPDDSHSIREQCLSFRRDKFLGNRDEKINEALALNWPFAPLCSAVALFQHHLIPTRLLDWSYNPLIAAYFAAQGAAEEFNKPKESKQTSDTKSATHLAIWAFNYESIYQHSGILHYRKLNHPETIVSSGESIWQAPPPGEARLVRVSAPTASNPNLRAQAGMFTLERLPADAKLNDPFKPRCFKDALEASYQASNGRGKKPESSRLYKLTLPIGLAGELLHALHLLRIDGAAVFPGMDGVKAALQEERWYPKKGSHPSH